MQMLRRLSEHLRDIWGITKGTESVPNIFSISCTDKNVNEKIRETIGFCVFHTSFGVDLWNIPSCKKQNAVL